jgi:predicted secreted hydrolase
MSDSLSISNRLAISRRVFAGGIALLGCTPKAALAQGFAGLGMQADGFAPVTPGRVFTFPADHGPHPEYRIEWWYLTANLADATGIAYGLQWTLFRQAMQPGAPKENWDNQQIWMGHAAVTSANTHRYSETFARGGVGQAGAEANPFHAWIDSWDMRGIEPIGNKTISPLMLTASGPDFNYTLRLDSRRDLILQGDHGYSRKSNRGQASYYYSQPYFQATGRIAIDDKVIDVSGQAWMDREWSSQPLASDQNGWDWFSLHFSSGEKLMLFRLRQADGRNYRSGNWIRADGQTEQIASDDIEMTPQTRTTIGERQVPTIWRINIPRLSVAIDCAPLNARSWMGTSFPYWEGPIRFGGTHTGLGYLEMTGY